VKVYAIPGLSLIQPVYQISKIGQIGSKFTFFIRKARKNAICRPTPVEYTSAFHIPVRNLNTLNMLRKL
jgi:hypothetical protein